LFLELEMHVGCYEFMTIVNSQDLAVNAFQLITVSDGSDDSGSMTFGWVIATPDGRRLARCSGPVFGPFGSSFRAEGCGFLSVSRFLVRLQEFFAIAPTWCIRMLTDNQGLISRLESSLPYIDPFPNLTLTADWDVTNEIVKSLRELPTPPTLAHVKGHQDDHIPYSDLPLDAQLNVDADAEAGYYQCTFARHRPIIHRLPSNSVQLHISGQVICSKLKQQIREAYTVPRISNTWKKDSSGPLPFLLPLIGQLTPVLLAIFELNVFK
jgi:hypothetical protein